MLRVNPAFTLITGYSAEDAIGQNPRILKSGRHDAAFFTSLWAHIEQQGQWQGETWNRRPNGEVYPVWMTITVVRDDHGAITHYVGTLQADIAMYQAKAIGRSPVRSVIIKSVQPNLHRRFPWI